MNEANLEMGGQLLEELFLRKIRSCGSMVMISVCCKRNHVALYHLYINGGNVLGIPGSQRSCCRFNLHFFVYSVQFVSI